MHWHGREFLSTPSARRATSRSAKSPASHCNFYPRPPRGGRRYYGKHYIRTTMAISIHALREEGDRLRRPQDGQIPLFLSTPSARRATQRLVTGEDAGSEFLSTPSARRATRPPGLRCGARRYFYPRPPRGGRPLAARCEALEKQISIHALREEGDHVDELRQIAVEISIHALREEGDLRAQSGRPWTRRFLSTPSARRATSFVQCCAETLIISIHALREEGDDYPRMLGVAERNFYPRPPRGGRRHHRQLPQNHPQISIHALREEGDGCNKQVIDLTYISIHALREEGDTDDELQEFLVKLFLSTPSARRATCSVATLSTGPTNFYPRPPRGGRLHPSISPCCTPKFLSTPSARRATRWTQKQLADATDFYPRPPRGGRPVTNPAAFTGGRISIHALREEGDFSF